MRVLIQDGRSKKYFNERDWVEDVREGANFVSHRLAYTIARQTSVAEFNIVLYSPVGKYSFNIDHGKN
jgi:hypothetical protein